VEASKESLGSEWSVVPMMMMILHSLCTIEYYERLCVTSWKKEEGNSIHLKDRQK
jgi:hypothetical protein